jgi:hypothetical protein
LPEKSAIGSSYLRSQDNKSGDEVAKMDCENHQAPTPAKAGAHVSADRDAQKWTPAFAGVGYFESQDF